MLNRIFLFSDANLQVIVEESRNLADKLDLRCEFSLWGFSGPEQQLEASLRNLIVNTEESFLFVFLFASESLFGNKNNSNFLCSNQIILAYERLERLITQISSNIPAAQMLIAVPQYKNNSDRVVVCKDGDFGICRSSLALEQIVDKLNRQGKRVEFLSLDKRFCGDRFVEESLKTRNFKLIFNPYERWVASYILGFVRRKNRLSIIKAVGFDLDDTLWRGVLGDDGIRNLKFDQSSLTAIRDFVAACNFSGIFTFIVSKNEFTTVADALGNENVPFSMGDFDIVHASWESKSSAILRICREFNIGDDSVLFLDDSVAEVCKLDEQTNIQVELIDHDKERSVFEVLNVYWELLRVDVLQSEDLVRKSSFNLTAGPLNPNTDAKVDSDFGSNLSSVFAVVPAENHLGRCVELLNKTNQFNNVGLIVSEEMVSKPKDHHQWFGITLEDRFLKYGVISCLRISVIDDSKVVQVENWVVSCRVFSRGLESFVIDFLKSEYQGFSLVVVARHTPKNSPFFRFLEPFERSGHLTLSLEDNG